MTKSANVKSIDAVRHFAAAVVQFREEAKLCATQLEMELRKVIGWLERDRPGFWKRESENWDRRHAEARVMLHQCRMRRVGDFRPTCFEEQKRVEHCKQQLEFSRSQTQVVKHWTIAAHQEADEYYGRSVQLIQTLERDLPRLIALLNRAIENLETYGNVQLPSWSPSKLDFGDPTRYETPAPATTDEENTDTDSDTDAPPNSSSDQDTTSSASPSSGDA